MLNTFSQSLKLHLFLSIDMHRTDSLADLHVVQDNFRCEVITAVIVKIVISKT
jgi:hypothetical protein